ncbi:zinc-dependent metalloprotease [Corynebacterium aquilae]|uniref:Hydrolase n=1 Tax=Corynebacterium aquilae DSM 44791 TaxID=1431546 RepID=A0A1L7CEH1_9CORY|nr:zinc-dependent metalloprotease [Corynebacterium aquilae]APT84218.1 hypothetical protein CAQU_03055 [Corynebacterium aquilae DSM 44791]
MSNGGFGFSFGNRDDDDRDDDNNRGGQPGDPFSFFFGPGFGSGSQGGGANPLGDMLSGFSNLFGPPQSGEEPDSFIDPEAVRKAVQSRITRMGSQIAKPASKDAAAVEEASRLAELWLDATTELATSGAKGTAWSAGDYALNSLPFWLRVAEPARAAVSETPVLGLGGDAQGAPGELMGAMQQFMRRQNAVMETQRVAEAVVQLSQSIVSGTDLGLPAAPANTLAIMTRTFRDEISSLDIPDQEALVYVCAREAARQRLFKNVPWLAESIVSSVEEWAAGAYVDTSHAEQYMRDNFDGANMENIAEIMQKMQSIDPQEIAPRLVSANENAVPRLEALIALIEGWVDVVVTEAVTDRLPNADKLRAAFKHRRNSGGTAATALEAITGCAIGTPPIDGAITLWERTTNAVGAARRDACWEHPDLAPSHEDIEHPARFIDRLLDDSIDADFDPIAEIEELEKKLGESDVDPESRENPTDEGD